MRRHSEGVHRPAKLQRAWLTARPPRQIASWLPRGSLAGGQTCCGSLKRAPQVRSRTLPRVAGSVDTAAAPGSGHVIACRCGRSRIRANGRRSSPERTSPRIGPRNGGRRIFRPRPFSTPGPCRPPVRSEAHFPRGERVSYYVLCIPEILQEGKTPGRARSGRLRLGNAAPPRTREKSLYPLMRLEEVQPFGRFACGTGRGGLALLRNSTVANTSSVSPMFTRSCTLNSPFR